MQKIYNLARVLFIFFFGASLNAGQMPPEKRMRFGLEDKKAQLEAEIAKFTSSMPPLHKILEAVGHNKFCPNRHKTAIDPIVGLAIATKQSPENFQPLLERVGDVKLSLDCDVVPAEFAPLIKNGLHCPKDTTTTFDVLMDQLFPGTYWRENDPSDQGIMGRNRIVDIKFLDMLIKDQKYPTVIKSLTDDLNRAHWTVYSQETGMVFQKTIDGWKILSEVVVYDQKLLPKSSLQEGFVSAHLNGNKILVVNNCAQLFDFVSKERYKERSFFVFTDENDNVDTTKVYAFLTLPVLTSPEGIIPMLFLIPRLSARLNPSGSYQAQYEFEDQAQ